MLCNDPHLGFNLPMIWYACHISVNGENLVGVTFPGGPGMVIGHNDDMGWGFTNLQADAVDMFVETLSATERFIVATLEGENNRWNVPVQPGRADDVAYVSDVIDHVAARVCTDQSRVYMTGFSGGARMTSLAACKLGSRLAAVAPVSGLRWPAPCDGRAVPVLTFHGLADPQNPYDGHAAGRGPEWDESVPDALTGWARHNGCKGDAILEDPPGPLSTMRYDGCGDAEVRMIRIDGLGHTWTKTEVDTTGVMWQFFKSHRLAP